MHRFTVASYNVLAHGYARPERYPRVPADVLDRKARYPAVAARVAGLALEAEIVCLQEVDADCLAMVAARVGPLGYDLRYAPKSGGRPDGCATLVRRGRFAIAAEETLFYDDGPRRSGHVALLLALDADDGTLHVANTHLRWDAPDAPPAARVGLRQARELAARAARVRGPLVVAGDFNAGPESAAVAELCATGLRDAFAEMPAALTFAASGHAARIDYLFASPELRPTPRAPPPLDDGSTLPRADEPSDHVPIVATFELTRA